MLKQGNPFDEIKKKHRDCIPMHLAQAAFNSTTYRIFGEGSAKKLRKFVMDKIGDGRRFISGQDFEREHATLVRQFPATIRLSAKSNKMPRFGHKAKVIDLYLKTLYCQREPLSAVAAKRLGQRLHVPLDRFVLEAVWKDFGQQLWNDAKRGHFNLAKLNGKRYHAIQKLLADRAKKAGTIAILYDDLYVVGSEQAR